MKKCVFATRYGEHSILVAEIVAETINAAWTKLLLDDPVWKTIFVVAADTTNQPRTETLRDAVKSHSVEEFFKLYPGWRAKLEMELMQ